MIFYQQLAQNINWTINKEIPFFLGSITTGTIASIEPGAPAAIKSRFILGFVSVNLTITPDTKTKTGGAKLFLCFVLKPTENPWKRTMPNTVTLMVLRNKKMIKC